MRSDFKRLINRLQYFLPHEILDCFLKLSFILLFMDKDVKFINLLFHLFAEKLREECLTSKNDERLLASEGENSRSQLSVYEEASEHPDGFLLKNFHQKTLHLLAIDHCFFSDSDPQRCDCLIFDDQFLCFVEFKLEVKPRKATDRLKEARDQLGSTIEFFKSEIEPFSESFFDFKLEAYVVMKEHVYPKQRASRESVFVKFLEKYGVALFESCQKTF